MDIQKIKADKLIPAIYNPRKNLKKGDAEYKKIERSILEFGYVDPIIVNKDMTIIGGHQRYKVLVDLGYDELDCVVVDLPKDREKALNIALNKVSGEWDEALLIDLLGDLGDLAELTGFDAEELDKLLDNKAEVKEDDFDADAAVAAIVEPITKRGDIWQLGRHRLMCGDSTMIDDVDKLMNGVKADMVFTDPPYGYEYQSNMRKKSKKFEVLKNDDKILDFLPIVKEICRGFVFVCTTWKVLDKWIPLFKKYYELTNMIIWDKGGGGIGDLEHTFLTDYEIILCSNNGSKITGKRLGSVWNLQKDNAKDYIHATQKPVKLSATAIENTTNTNNIVVDLFGGSGSTLIACEQLNRTCYMMELDPKYCDVIIKRYEELTGQKAELIS